MTHYTLNLFSYRVKVAIASTRRGGHDKLISALEELTRVRVGSRLSRLVRLAIEHVKLPRRFLGANLVALTIATNVITPSVSAFTNVGQAETEVVTLPISEEPIKTTVVRRYPVEEPRITQGYHLFHAGIDIDGLTGDPIYPVMNGTVKEVKRDFFLGKAITVRHEDGYETVYAHLDTIEISVNQKVTTNTQLGQMGTTGRAFGDHLHLEVIKDGRHVNPLTVLPPRY
ncbi:M23 family metallopeptidase [Candidatus Microgenomates bacterium]|nr:M23 family metallopeptidase [Candidatus Microgenomates bacterium]